MSTHGSRSFGRVCTVTLLAAVAAGLPAAPAFADSATPPASKTNWYWSLVAPVVQGNALPVPVGVPAPVSLVPAGDLGVGYGNDQLGESDKAAAVAFDLTAIPFRSTFSSFLVTVLEDPKAQQVTAETPDITACELLDAFPDGPGPTDLAKIPPASPASCVKGTFNAALGKAGGYVFDLTSVANDWSGGAPANGILIAPTPSKDPARKPFSLSLLGKAGITTKAEYTPPPAEVTPPPPVALPGPVLPPAPQLPGFVQQPEIPAIGPPVMPGMPVIPVIPAPKNNPPPVSQQSVAGAGYAPGSLTPGTNWWFALLGLLALLGLTSVVLGDPMAPVVVDSRRRRFAAVVSAQPVGTSAGPSPRTVSHPRPA